MFFSDSSKQLYALVGLKHAWIFIQIRLTRLSSSPAAVDFHILDVILADKRVTVFLREVEQQLHIASRDVGTGGRAGDPVRRSAFARRAPAVTALLNPPSAFNRFLPDILKQQFLSV